MMQGQDNAEILNVERIRFSHIIAVIFVCVVVCAIYILGEMRLKTGLGFPLDDPWIHFRFAQNIARGYGFCYNPGQPVSGSTSPLWTFMLALIHLFTDYTVYIIVAVKILGIALFAGAAIFAYLIALRITRNSFVAILASLFVTLTSPLDWGAISGLEVPLYILLTLSGVYFADYTAKHKYGILAPILFAFAVYARPECLLLFVFYVVDYLLNYKHHNGLMEIVKKSIIYIVLLIPYFLFNYHLSGSIFPNTFRAKVGGMSIFSAITGGHLRLMIWLIFISGPSYFWDFIRHTYRANPLIPFGLLLGLIFWIYYRKRTANHPSFLILFIVVFYSTFIGIVAPFQTADFQMGRYIANQTALGVMLAVLGFYWLVKLIYLKKKNAGIALAVFLFLLAVFNTISAQRSMFRIYTSNVESINMMQVQIGKWLRENTAQEAVIATNDIGAIGYFSRRPIIDIIGLVTPEIIPYFDYYREHKSAVLAFLQDNKPDYVVVFPRYFPELLQAHEVVYHVRVSDNTASEYVFPLKTDTFLGLALLRVTVKPAPSTMVVLKTKW